MGQLNDLKQATSAYGYDRVGAVINAIEPSYNANPGRYANFENRLAAEVNENVNGVGRFRVLTPGSNILAMLERQLDANPALQPRLVNAIRNNPNGVAGMLDDFHAGRITLDEGLTRLERAAPPTQPRVATPAPRRAETPAPRRAEAPAAPASGDDRLLNQQERAALERELTVFSQNGATPEEVRYMQELVRREANDGRGINVGERRYIQSEMERLRPEGNQVVQPAAGAPAPAAPVAPPAAPAAPAAPPRYSPPDQLTPETYGELMTHMGGTMTALMPEGMAVGNDGEAFQQRLTNPEFRDRFIQLYNSDPQYRQAIRHLYQDADRLAQLKERGGDRELDPNSEIGRRSALLQGQFRSFITNPDDLLNVNKVMDLQQGVSGLANFAGSMAGMLDQMPPWIRGLLSPVMELFNIISPAFSQAGFSEMGQMARNAMGAMGLNADGLSFAGNGGGLAGLMSGDGPLGGLMNMFTGGGTNTGAGSGAPAPPALANNDPNRVQPATPSLGQNGPGAPPAAPVNV